MEALMMRIRTKKRGWFVATTMALSCCGWCGMRFAPSPLPPLIMNHFSLESGAKPPDPAKGGKAVRRPRTVSELKSEQSRGRGGEIKPRSRPPHAEIFVPNRMILREEQGHWQHSHVYLATYIHSLRLFN